MKRLLVVLALLCTSGARADIDFSAFHSPAQVNAELDNLAADFPASAQLFSIGNSVEGRPIRGIKISSPPGDMSDTKADVIVIALQHAREWITVEWALFLAEYLLQHGGDADLAPCLANVRVWIIPVSNPDGYVFSTTPGNRMWRKNRRDNGDGTFGVDLNRNFSVDWSGSGSSTSTMSDQYRGTAPFSEPEASLLRDFVQGLPNPRALLNYHSYTEAVLQPWRYTTADAPGEQSLIYMADDARARIQAVHGEVYGDTVGYTSSGNSLDYFWSMRLAAFTTEMRPKTEAAGGFDPPPSLIVPNAEENLPAALAWIRDAGCRRLWIKDHAADTGAVRSATWLGDHWSHAFWTSPDIAAVPAVPAGGSTADLSVTVRNDTGSPVSGARLRVAYTDPAIALAFPDPANVVISDAALPSLPPGASTHTFPWNVPAGLNSVGEPHWCIGAVVYHPDDRPLTTHIEKSSNIGGRNFTTIVMDDGDDSMSLIVKNVLDVPVVYRATLPELPRGWSVELLPLRQRKDPPRIERLLKPNGQVLLPGERVIQPIRIRRPLSAPSGTRVLIRVDGTLAPLLPGRKPVTAGNGYAIEAVVP